MSTSLNQVILDSVDDEERIPMLQPPSTGRQPRNSWPTTAFFMAAAMAGVGVLGMPTAVAESGWVGILVLCVTAGVCLITANLLGSLMNRMNQASIYDYPSIGAAAFGRAGAIAATAAQYSTLVGVSVIFMLLTGIMLNIIFCAVPIRLFALGVGVYLFVVLLIFPKLGEVSWSSYVAVGTTFLATIVSVSWCLMYYFDNNHVLPLGATQAFLDAKGIGTAFAVFSFSFGGHSLLPNFFIEMKHPRHFYKSTLLAVPSVLFLLYIPMGVAGYLAYGTSATGGNIIGTFFEYPLKNQQLTTIGVDIAAVAIAIHLVTALPLLATPICIKMQHAFLSKENRRKRSLGLVLVRAGVVALLTLTAIIFPYFLDLISIVTALSVVSAVYILPCLFFWKLGTSLNRDGVFKCWVKRVGLLLIIGFGVTGSVASLYVAVPKLICDVSNGGNPFANMFVFGCSVSNSTNATQC